MIRNAFWCVQAMNCRCTIFMFGWDQYVFHKKRRDTLRRTCLLASDGIWGSCSALRCIRGTKHRHTIFEARVGPVEFP
jgi:hypothetical protein